jgi:hypothetical protein
VTARVSRAVYGVKTRRKFDGKNPEHQERAHKKYIDAAGEEKLREGFDVILGKVPFSFYNGTLISHFPTDRILKYPNPKNFASKDSAQRVLSGELRKSYQSIYGRTGDSWRNQSGWMSIPVRFMLS